VAASPLHSQRQRQSGANEDSSVDGVSDLGNGGMGVLPCGKGPWFRWTSSAERWRGKPARQEASAITVCGSRTGRQRPTRVMPSLDRQKQGSPFAGKQARWIAAGARGTPIRGTIRGRRCRHKRLTGVNVDGVVPKLAQAVRAARQGPKTEVRPAQAGSCPGNWRFYRVPI
jgi:hypothetical protein